MKKFFVLAAAGMMMASSAYAAEQSAPVHRASIPHRVSYNDGTNAIREVEGTHHQMSRWTIGYFLLPQRFDLEEDLPTLIVEGNDGFVYIRNIVTDYPQSSYIKGTKNGNRVTFDFPQEAGGEKSAADPTKFFAMNYDVLEYSAEANTYVVSTTKRSVDFIVGEDGSYTMDLGYTIDPANAEVPQYIIGATYAQNNMWNGAGDCQMVLTPSQFELQTPPEGLATEKWSLTAQSGGSTKSVNVNVGFDGNDVWMQGVYPMLPDSWVKGTYADGKVTFAEPSYIGIYDDVISNIDNLYFLWMTGIKGGTFEVVPMVFNYDPEAKKMTYAEEGVAWCVNVARKKAKILEDYSKPELTYIGEISNYQPEAPTMFNFAAPDPATGEGHFTFNFNPVNTDGNPLDLNKLYVNLLVDGIAEPFTPEDYMIESEMTDIPLTLMTDDMKIMSMAAMGVNMMDLTFYALGYDTIGVSLVYVDGDTRTYSKVLLSDGSYADAPGSNNPDDSGVSLPTASSQAVYYDITGRKVETPAQGQLYIMRQGHISKKIIF